MTIFKSLLAAIAVATLLGACATEGGMRNAETGAASEVAARMDSKYVVYFRRKSVHLTEKSQGVLYDAMQAKHLKKAKNVGIIAYGVTRKNKHQAQQLASYRLERLAKQFKEAGGASNARRAEIILK